MIKTAALPIASVRTSATTIVGDSTACDTGFSPTTSRPDSLAELSRFWIFDEDFFRQPTKADYEAVRLEEEKSTSLRRNRI